MAILCQIRSNGAPSPEPQGWLPLKWPSRDNAGSYMKEGRRCSSQQGLFPSPSRTKPGSVAAFSNRLPSKTLRPEGGRARARRPQHRRAMEPRGDVHRSHGRVSVQGAHSRSACPRAHENNSATKKYQWCANPPKSVSCNFRRQTGSQ